MNWDCCCLSCWNPASCLHWSCRIQFNPQQTSLWLRVQNITKQLNFLSDQFVFSFFQIAPYENYSPDSPYEEPPYEILDPAGMDQNQTYSTLTEQDWYCLGSDSTQLENSSTCSVSLCRVSVVKLENVFLMWLLCDFFAMFSLYWSIFVCLTSQGHHRPVVNTFLHAAIVTHPFF